MSKTLSYAEQLRHPNWQRRRLERLNGAGWACECCYDAESTLHVHHKRYVKGRMAWEYSDAELAVLCEGCHADAHAGMDALTAIIGQLPLDGPRNLRDAASLLAGWASNRTPDIPDLSGLAEGGPQLWLGQITSELEDLLYGQDLSALLTILKDQSRGVGFLEKLRALLAEFVPGYQAPRKAEGGDL